jgi:hypothetical protein
MRTSISGSITSFVVFVVMLALIVENIAAILGLIGIVAVVAILIIVAKNSDKQEKLQQQEAYEEYAQKMEQQKIESTQSQIDDALELLTEKHGAPDRVIRPNDLTDYGYFALFVNHKVIYINDIAFPFADIASYKLVDNCQITKGNISGSVTTSADTKDVVISSLAGDFWGGKTGAIIGGATAQKHSSVNLMQSNDTLVHDYTLLINLKGINREGIEMHIGDDWRLAAELEHLFDQIIKESNSSMP